MQVVRATQFGGPEVLVPDEAPDPAPGPGEVVVEVHAADTLFLDTVIRSGAGGDQWGVRPPYVPGAGLAGPVAAVGEDVDDAWLDHRVAVKTGAGGPRPATETIAEAGRRTTPTGGYAALCRAPVPALTPVPDEVDTRAAAALVNDGLTAILLSETVHVTPGERVLVTPAAGGVGSLLVQLARAAGAHVTAAARGQRKLTLARELGADEAVDYSSSDWPTRVREATGDTGPDVVLDGVGGQVGRDAFALTAPGGRFVAFGTPAGSFTVVSPEQARERDVSTRSILELEWTVADEQRLPAQALARAATGQISPLIGQTFPLARAAEAHAAIEARQVVGKTLLLP